MRPRVHRPLTALELGDIWLVAQVSLEAAYREDLVARGSDLGRSEIVALQYRLRRAEVSEEIARKAAGSAARQYVDRHLAIATAAMPHV